MTQHGLTPEYRERVATALADLVDTTPTQFRRAAASPLRPQRRATWVTAAVAVALLPLLLIAVIAPIRSQTIDAIGRSGLLPICSSELVAPFDCHDYLLSASSPDTDSGISQNATAWFERTSDQQIRLTVQVNDRWIQIPVSHRTATTATGAAVEDRLSSRLDCAPESGCSLQAAIANLFSHPTIFTITDTGFTVTDGNTTYTGTRTRTIHRPVLVALQQRDSRTLLTYTPTSDISAAAFNGADLTTNEAGCITAGNTVLVLPDSARLNNDGTIDFNGHRLAPGRPVNLSGGIGPIPTNAPCGNDVNYWWVGIR